MSRRDLDNYPTPMAEEMLAPLFSLIPALSGDVIEPCAGEGQLSGAIGRTWRKPVTTNDIVPEYNCTYTSDATDPTSPIWKRQWGWVITNCPFSLAYRILPLAFEHAIDGVAFLLRLSYAEPAKNRHEWLDAHADNQRYQVSFNPRPHFREGEINPDTGKLYGTDPVTVAWFVWLKRWSWSQMGLTSPFVYIHGWK